MFLSMFDDIKEFTKQKTSGNVPPRIDSVMLMSLRLVAFLTGLACITVTANTYIGDNINCVAGSVAMSGEEITAVESYCFITSTFTIGNVTMPGQAAHPGVAGPVPHREVFLPGTGPADEKSNSVEAQEVVTHSYYQWVPFMLALQAMMLYLPSLLWEKKDNGHFESILANTHRVHVDKKEALSKVETSAKFFEYSMHHANTKYFVVFFFYEVLGFVVALANLFITNVFLGGKFFYFGKEALRYLSSSVSDPNNPLNEVFPKVGKCTWHRFGPSGSIESLDALCVLPLNIVNEKTYIVLWIAYVALCVVTGVMLIYHIILFSVALERLIVRRTALGDRQNVSIVLGWCSIGDKFMLWCLQGYIINFSQWLSKLVSISHHANLDQD